MLLQEDKIIRALNLFSHDLYNKLKNSEDNLFFSPFSIFSALAMVYSGARGNTEDQIKQTLHITLDKKQFQTSFKKLSGILNDGRGSELNIANLLCIQNDYKILENFLWLIEDFFNGILWELDFNKVEESCKKINNWVSEHTKGKIDKIIDDLNENMAFLIINAIYFKGEWRSKFKEKDTKDNPFFLISGDTINIPMMRQISKFRFIEEENYQILELPYKEIRVFGILEHISMVIFLPKKKNGLEMMEKILAIEKIMESFSLLKNLDEKEIKIIIPRFIFETKYEISRILSELGMSDAFTSRADLSGISKNPPECISQILHKAFIEVNETGTEAAAVTSIRVLAASLRPQQKPPEFRADHPFLFFIIDSQTRTILFMGRIMNPIV